MAEIKKKPALITKTDRLTCDIVSMWIEIPEIAAAAKAGQFVSLYCKDGSRLLPRPISICEIDKESGSLRLVYRIVGEGTKEFSSYVSGEFIDVMGPLGNGFDKNEGKAILIGGGIGIPPMLQLAKELECEKEIVLGYRDILFLHEEFLPYGKVTIATEDGFHGTKGNVLDAIKQEYITADIIYACGPAKMLEGIQEYGRQMGIPTRLSMEEKMACGIGACLACVCKSKDKDHHSNVNNKRVCMDGPVFDGEEVLFS